MYSWYMKTLLVTTPEARIESTAANRLLPRDFRGWKVETLPSGSLAHLSQAPELTVVRLDEKTQPARLKAVIQRLANLQTTAPSGSYVVFAITQAAVPAQRSEAVQKRFNAICTVINGSLREFTNPDRVDISIIEEPGDLEPKLRLIEAKLETAPPRSSPLDKLEQVINATADLRSGSGKLSATAVAEAFNISVNQLASWLGRNRQAISKTPDADSLQNELAFFEKVARLRAAVKKEGFLKWLRMPNSELEDKTPLDLLAEGEGQVVADLVDDMLTGAPA